MKLHHLKLIAIVSLIFMSGCVGYDRGYRPYIAPHPAVVPYGGYSYGGYPASRPFVESERGFEGNREYRDYGSFRRHEHD